MKQNKYPITDEITMVIPTEITDLGVYVDLIEYKNLKGLIILSELCNRKRIKSIKKLITIGKKFPATVVSVDDKTGYISLSKKTTTEEEATQHEEHYKITKQVDDILQVLSKKLEKDHQITFGIDNIYERLIWPLSTEPEIILSIFKSIAHASDKVCSNIIYGDKLININPTVIECFEEILVQRFKLKDVILQGVMEITCFQPQGINIIKNSLIKSQKMSVEENPYQIKLIKSPYYSIIMKTKDQKKALDIINDALKLIEEDLINSGATFNIIKKPEINQEELKIEDLEQEESEDEEEEFDD